MTTTSIPHATAPTDPRAGAPSRPTEAPVDPPAGAPTRPRDTARRHPVWLPMTTMPRYLSAPVTITRASGSTLFDQEGQPYVSANSALWNVACGYGDPRISEAVIAQLEQLPYSTLFRYGHRPALDLAERLLALADLPGLATVFYTTSGGSAVDTALRLARRHHRLTGQPDRTLVAHFADSYHGTVGAALSVTGEDLGQSEAPADTRDYLRLPTPECSASAAAALDQLAQHADTLAAVIAEPVLGSAGVVDVHPAFWEGLARLRDRTGLLFIADEVATGIGRTGTLFASHWLPLEPDLLITSKALNNGYLPLAAILVSEHIAAACDAAGETFYAGETQAGNPLACVASLATLEVIEQDDLLTRAAELAAVLRSELADLADQPGAQVQAVTGRGLMIGVHLAGPSGRPDLMQVNQICERFRSLGVIVHASPRGFSLFPPFTLTDEELETLLEALRVVLTEVELP